MADYYGTSTTQSVPRFKGAFKFVRCFIFQCESASGFVLIDLRGTDLLRDCADCITLDIFYQTSGER